MASIKPYPNGFRAFVCVKGVRESAAFRTKREAKAKMLAHFNEGDWVIISSFKTNA